MEPATISPRSGTAFRLARGEILTVIDPQGQQVADLVAFSAADLREVISSGRSLDYASKLYLTEGDDLYSNRSNVMLRIVEDKVGRHDFLLTPCSKDAFNCFMNVVIQPNGVFTVEAPLSRSGDFIKFRAEMDLVIGLTACSALQSNNYAFKPIAYLVE
jgi:uncharacterized protein YcgI (DUF1989 family)